MICAYVSWTTQPNSIIYYIRRLQTPKLHKHLRKWKFKLARLNDRIDLYFKTNYKVVDYCVKKPNLRTTEITQTPYGYHQWRRRRLARLRCIRAHHGKPHITINIKSATNKRHRRMHFDSDSYDIMVDNCCSQSITNNLEDYIDPPTTCTIKIRGYNSLSTKNTKVGTVRWQWADDNGRIHEFHLPNTYYAPEAETRLLSPQHWAQSSKEKTSNKCTTYHDSIILEWGHGKYKRTLPISKETRNVGIITTRQGIHNFQKWTERLKHQAPLLVMPTTIDWDGDPTTNDTVDPTSITPMDHPTRATKILTKPNVSPAEVHTRTPKKGERTKRTPQDKRIRVTFQEPEEEGSDDDAEPTYMDEKHEYMRWHYKLNHASQRTMTRMAHQKLLPRFITKILKKMEKSGSKAPLCNDCYSACASRTQWRHKPCKGAKTKKRELLSPGDVVSVDQLESSTPGFLAQIMGTLTRKRIIGTSVYVDQASDLSYIYHHTSLSSEETVKGKEAFETYARAHGVHVKHYHADNGRFKDRGFTKSLEENKQTITYAGVGAHHQNGIAEKRIGDLQRKATTLLLHAQRRWPDAISTSLWPYALRAANDSMNIQPRKNEKECPISKFCLTGRVPTVHNQHHFGCPVYVLQKELQDGKKARKWTDRTRIGINLGYSPRHAHNVSLVMNLETGLVSPQFHCLYDDMFETTTGRQARSIPRAKWKEKSGLEDNYEELINDDPSTEDTEDDGSNHDSEAEEESPNEGAESRTRSGRLVKRPERLTYEVFETILEPYDYANEERWCERELIAYKASTDPDTMYYHQAMREPDKEKFKEAISKECEDHFRMSNYKLISVDQVPKDATLLSSVWQMKRKRKPSTGEISKYKARMNVNGKEQVKGLHYDETYAPVVAWATIRFFLSMALLKGWHTRQLDFLLAYTQADIERDLYMKLPPGFMVNGRELTEDERKKHVLKLEKNLYGQKQAGRVWYLHLKKNLERIGFKVSKHDECLFYYGRTIFIVYTDDTILLGPDKIEVDELVKKLGKIFRIEDQGNLTDYLGMKIEKHKDGSMTWTQPNLIQSILKDLGLVGSKTANKATSRTTPANSTTILTDHAEEPPHDETKFNYRQVIGKLLYLEKSTRPDIACAVHQCARFSANPKTKHTEAVKRIGRYLLGTQDKGLVMKPNQEGMECWVDASHASEWSNKSAEYDPNTARSRMGYLITYGGCPMHWASKMQTEIALSSTEAEYIALSQAMREVIPIMWLLKEARDMGVPVMNEKPKVMCKVFEDNAGAIEIANVPKMRPRTKHLNIKYHHFREEVKKGTIKVYHVGTEEQIADIFTKALDEGLFRRFRVRMMGW